MTVNVRMANKHIRCMNGVQAVGAEWRAGKEHKQGGPPAIEVMPNNGDIKAATKQTSKKGTLGWPSPL